MRASDADRYVGSSVWDDLVPTPLVYVDLRILEQNIDGMATRTAAAGLALRPHVKTHKIGAIAKRQLDAGAVGLTVAKLGEAQALADQGFAESVMIAQPFVGREKARWCVELGRRQPILVCVDNLDEARTIGRLAASEDAEIEVVLIVDTGYFRFGVPADVAPDYALALEQTPGVSFRGIRSHAGHIYGAGDEPSRLAIVRTEVEMMAATADRIRSHGIACSIVSVGSTPGAHRLLGEDWTAGVTEVRPGNYVFHDRMQMSLGNATQDDCALRVILTVISQPRPGTALADGGLMTLTATLDDFANGYGIAVNRPDVELVKLSQECVLLQYGDSDLPPGSRLMVIPNHACELTNLTDVVFFGAEDRLDGYWVPEGRGKVW